MKKAITLLFFALSISASAQRLTPEQKDLLRSVEAEKYIRCECSSNSIFVKGSFWGSLPIDNKQTISLLYSIKCANERGSGLYYIKIFDYYSGRKLAKYSKSYGFDVY